MTRGQQPPAPAQQRLRSVERLIWLVLLAAVLIVGAGIAWRLTVEQITFLCIGVSCLAFAWMVWRHGIIGYSHSEGFDPETGETGPPATTVTRSPLPRSVLAPLLVAAAIVFLLAGTRTGLGSALYGPAHGAVWAWELAGGLWDVVLTAAFGVVLVGLVGYGVIRRDGASLIAGAGLLAFAALANAIFYLVDERLWRQQWHDYLAPLRTLVELVT